MKKFSQKNDKINLKILYDIDSEPIINLLNKNRDDKLISILEKYSHPINKMHSYYPGVVYGKPNGILKGLENSPWFWFFEFSNNVQILMFSDGFRKNHFKGTSYEIVNSNSQKINKICDALDVFFNDFQSKFQNQFPEEHAEMQIILKKSNIKD